MNIEYAQTIPLRAILDKLGFQPAEEKDNTLLYASPFFEKASISLQVNVSDNTWQNTILKRDRGPFELVQAVLAYRNERCSIHDVLHWLRFNIGYPALSTFLTLPDDANDDDNFTFKCKTQLQERGLIRYVESRGIPADIAKKFLKQIYVMNKATGNEFVAVGIRNEDHGFAIRNAFVKATLKTAAIKFIRGSDDKPDAVHVFKDMFDYLSALISHNDRKFKEDCIILNAYRCIDNAAAYIRGYGYSILYSWMGNDEIGQQATNAFDFLCRTEPDMHLVPMNHLYTPQHDMNSFIVERMEQ